MSSTAFTAESEWLGQLAAMREAIAELRLGQQNGLSSAYGNEVPVDDEDDDSNDSTNDDIWDVYSEIDGSEYSSDLLNGAEGYASPKTKNYEHSSEWLNEKCKALAGRTGGLSASELQDEISVLLSSDTSGGISA